MDFAGFLPQLWGARWAIGDGLLVTLAIAATSIVLGTLLGIGVGLLLTYGSWPVRAVTRGYTDFIRGTPVLVLILASFYVLGVVGIHLTAFEAGVFALTVFCSSHVGEILRGALQSIGKGQTEAGLTIGLTFRQVLAYVLLPQAVRQILPTWVNTAAEMVKASTLLSVIGVVELLLATQEVISRNFMSLQFYFFAGLLYFLINFGIERVGRYLERRFTVPA